METKTRTIELTSTAFNDGDMIPEEFAQSGKNVSPPLQWGNAPEETATFAILCEDPDAPRGTFAHWVMFNISTSRDHLEEGIPPSRKLEDSSKQGVNSAGHIGYVGPAPPKGETHRYVFRIFALDTVLRLGAGATREELLDAMEGHILAEGTLTGRYKS